MSCWGGGGQLQSNSDLYNYIAVYSKNEQRGRMPLLRVIQGEERKYLHRQVLHQKVQQKLLHWLHPEALQSSTFRITKEFDSLRYRKDTWICYCCQEICHCERCKKSELLSIERKNSKKKPPKTPPPLKNNGEESIDNSQSNFSQSINSKPIEPPSGVLPKQLENEEPKASKNEKIVEEEP